MNTNEQTMYQGGDATQLQSHNSMRQDAPAADSRWKLIAMGGVPGVLVGAGALYAGTAVAGNAAGTGADTDKGDDDIVTLDVATDGENHDGDIDSQHLQAAPEQADSAAVQAAAASTTVNVNVNIGTDTDTAQEVTVEVPVEASADEGKAVLYSEVGHVEIYSEAPVAQSVDDSMTFGEAFAAARAEVGPGGVFHYRGGDYGTYYAEEWQSMTPEEHHLYADSVHPEVPANEVDVPVDNPNDITINITINGEDVHATVDDKQPESEPADNGLEVSFEGYAQVTTPDGDNVNVLGMTVDGEEVAFIDIDGDNQFDYAVSDINGDGELQEGELIDLSTGEAVPFDDVLTGTDDPTLTADAGDIDLGADFINDADVQFG